MSNLNVATVASDVVWASIHKNIEQTKAHVKKVKDLFPDTQIILFPEMSLTGYILDETNKTLAQPLDGAVVQSILDIAKQHNISIIASMIGKGKKPFNTTFVAGADGNLITHYNKNHLFTQCPEPDLYDPGQTLSTFNINGWKCGLSTCFDIRFPRLFETYKKAGVECMFSPMNWLVGRNKENLMNYLIKVRAHENQFFFVAVDRTGKDENAEYHGIGVITNPFAEDIAAHKDIYSYASLDKSEIKMLSDALPLNESYKETYTIKDD